MTFELFCKCNIQSCYENVSIETPYGMRRVGKLTVEDGTVVACARELQEAFLKRKAKNKVASRHIYRKAIAYQPLYVHKAQARSV